VKSNKVSIADLRHRVKLCTALDVVVEGEGLRLARKEAFGAWAAIEAKRGSMYGPNGVVIQENANVQSHLIVLRYRYDFVISSAAWIFEEPLKSEPRWYKILSVKDTTSEWWTLSCRIVEKADDISQPQGDASEERAFLVGLPQGVKL
jgi:hypothetical protein